MDATSLTMEIDIPKQKKRHYLVTLCCEASLISIYKRKNNDKLVIKKEINFLEEKETDLGLYIRAMVTEYHKS